LTIQFKLGWKKHKGISHRKLKTVLSEAGIYSPEKIRGRDIKRVHKELDYLIGIDVLKSWRPIDDAKPIDAVYEFVIADKHLLKKYMVEVTNES
jgi:hypothetical protein